MVVIIVRVRWATSRSWVWAAGLVNNYHRVAMSGNPLVLNRHTQGFPTVAAQSRTQSGHTEAAAGKPPFEQAQATTSR